MSNQLKDILKKGFAAHGYPVDVQPKTLKDIEEKADDLSKSIEKKVDKIEDKNLSSNDYTNEDKSSLKSATEKLKNLNLSDISAADDVPEWKQPIHKLFDVALSDFNNARYSCCFIPDAAADFPDVLKESDTTAFVITRRNENTGIQTLIGADSGNIITRCKNINTLTDWSKPVKLIDSYTSDLIDVAPSASALHQAYLSLTDKIMSLDMIVTGGDISVFPTEALIPEEGGTIEIIIKTTEEWAIKQI